MLHSPLSSTWWVSSTACVNSNVAKIHRCRPDIVSRALRTREQDVIRWSENGRRRERYILHVYPQPGFPLLLVTRSHNSRATAGTPLTTKLPSRRDKIGNHQTTTGVPEIDWWGGYARRYRIRYILFNQKTRYRHFRGQTEELLKQYTGIAHKKETKNAHWYRSRGHGGGGGGGDNDGDVTLWTIAIPYWCLVLPHGGSVRG